MLPCTDFLLLRPRWDGVAGISWLPTGTGMADLRFVTKILKNPTIPLPPNGAAELGAWQAPSSLCHCSLVALGHIFLWKRSSGLFARCGAVAGVGRGFSSTHSTGQCLKGEFPTLFIWGAELELSPFLPSSSLSSHRPDGGSAAGIVPGQTPIKDPNPIFMRSGKTSIWERNRSFLPFSAISTGIFLGCLSGISPASPAPRLAPTPPCVFWDTARVADSFTAP